MILFLCFFTTRCYCLCSYFWIFFLTVRLGDSWRRESRPLRVPAAVLQPSRAFVYSSTPSGARAVQIPYEENDDDSKLRGKPESNITSLPSSADGHTSRSLFKNKIVSPSFPPSSWICPFRRTQKSACVCVCVCTLEFIKPLFSHNDCIVDIAFTHRKHYFGHINWKKSSSFTSSCIRGLIGAILRRKKSSWRTETRVPTTRTRVVRRRV